MPKLLDRAARLTLALLVAGGLGIGARSAVAASGSASPCTYDHGSGRIPVSCTTHAQCDAPCQSYYGEWSAGACMKGCCICAI